jgi:hypothetical protein
VGERLLLALLDLARARGAREATLEVRPSNTAARRLYEKYGFQPMGVRPRYYSDDHEDALIMTTEPLNGRMMRERVMALRAEVAKRPDIEVGDDGLPTAGPSPHSQPEGSPGPQPDRLGNSPGSSPSTSGPNDPRVLRPSRMNKRDS